MKKKETNWVIRDITYLFTVFFNYEEAQNKQN